MYAHTRACTHARTRLYRYDTVDQIITAVDAIPYTQGGTYTSTGINTVRTQLMTPANGLRPLTSGVSRVLIVMTDGGATNGYWPDAEAALIKRDNVNVFAMGVGSGINETQLNVIASSPDNVYVTPSLVRPPYLQRIVTLLMNSVMRLRTVQCSSALVSPWRLQRRRPPAGKGLCCGVLVFGCRSQPENVCTDPPLVVK
jgi:hypothetical protein